MRKVRVAITPDLQDYEEVKALSTRSTEVEVIDLSGYDVILGSNCWFITPEYARYIPLAVKQARARVKGVDK